MRDVLGEIDGWLADGRKVALATVVSTWGSAPRRAGSHLAVASDGRMAGSVSGGCVEAAVVEEAQRVLASGRPKLLRFGVADETAWAVGLSCGGAIEVFVEALDPERHRGLREALLAGRPLAVATVVSGPEGLLGKAVVVGAEGAPRGDLGPLTDAAVSAAREALAAGRSERRSLGEAELFLEALLPPPRLVMVGGVHIAVALTSLARALGYATLVVDPRPAFGSTERFPHADRVVSAWPDEFLAGLPLDASTAVAVLTHDPKLDDPALRVALPSPAFYVGALGSKATQARRRARLLAAGLTEAQVERLHAPIGLDLGGRGPEEIALSVMAQIVAVRNAAITASPRLPAAPLRPPAR
jgi:xanthine dehydrogenase accessory factor